MTTLQRGIGNFTTQNLVAVFRAVPQSNGTYVDVARIAEELGSHIHAQTIARWMKAGNADIRKGDNATAYARFAKIYKDRLKEHGGAEVNRSRELDYALEIIAGTCACGKQKMLLEDGTGVDQCQVCHALDAPPRHGRLRTAPSPTG